MKRFFSTALVLIGLLTCISCGYLFSSVLISSDVLQFSTTLSSETKNIFALSTAKNTSKTELQSMCSDIQSKNGAGYIYKKEETFYLLASAYENYNDAEKVKANLSAQGINCEVLKIEVSSTSISGSFSNDEKKVVQNCLNSPFETYQKLYDIAVSLDTSLYDLTKAKLECNNIFSLLIANMTNLETVSKDDSSFDKLKKSIDSQCEILSDLISENYHSNKQNFSSLIKFSYLKILLEN